MTEERDIVTFTDENGSEFDLEVMDYFFYNGQEYAVLADVEEDSDCADCACGHAHEHDHAKDHAPAHDHAACACGHDHAHEDDDDDGDEQEIYIMKVVQMEDDMEEFVPVEDELMEKLIEIVQARMEEDFEEEDGDGVG